MLLTETKMEPSTMKNLSPSCLDSDYWIGHIDHALRAGSIDNTIYNIQGTWGWGVKGRS